MSVENILLIVAAVLAVISIFESNGRAWVAWAVLIICAVLLLF